MKTLNISQRVTLRELYLGYSLKTRDIESKTIPVPYFPKSEITTHKHSLTYKEWKRIILIYFKHLVFYLMETGFSYKIPSRLGLLQIRKYKSKKIPDWGKTKEVYGTTKVKPIYYKNTHTSGYRPIIKWYRSGQEAKFKYKWYWRFNFTPKSWSTVSKAIFSKLTLINKYQSI
jgi:hypothetical protein